MPNVRPPYPNELYHYGVKGMHWGVRRYQPYPKGYSGSGKYLGKRSRVGMFGKKAKVRKLSDDEKEQLIRLGTVNELLKYSDQLSTEERNRAATRVESQRRLKALRYSGALKTYNDVTTAVGNTSKILKTGLEIKKLGGDANKKAPKDYSYDSISMYYDKAPRNGTGADWSGIYGGSKVDKLTNKEREEKLRKRRRNIAIASGALGAAALAGAGYVAYKNRRSIENKIRNKGHKAFNESRLYNEVAADESAHGLDKLLYRNDITSAERRKLAQHNFDRADKLKKKDFIKRMQSNRYDALADKVANRRNYLAGALSSLGVAGVSHAVKEIRKNRKRKGRR